MASCELFYLINPENGMIILCPKQDLNLGPSRIAVFKDCKATALITQPLTFQIKGYMITILETLVNNTNFSILIEAQKSLQKLNFWQICLVCK